MKSIKTGIFAVALALGLLTLAPARLQAQVPTKVTFALVATYQAPDVVSGVDQNITKSTTKTLKVTSASLVSLLSLTPKSYFTLDIGGGSTLNVGTVSSVDPSGNVTDESSFITVTLGDLVYSGSADSDKMTASETYTADLTITIDDGNGNAGTLEGLIKVTDSLAALTAAQNNNGLSATESVSFSGTVTGSGTVVGSDGNTDTAVFTGTVSGSGKGPTGT
jgi:hypothetical protein